LDCNLLNIGCGIFKCVLDQNKVFRFVRLLAKFWLTTKWRTKLGNCFQPKNDNGSFPVSFASCSFATLSFSYCLQTTRFFGPTNGQNPQKLGRMVALPKLQLDCNWSYEYFCKHKLAEYIPIYICEPAHNILETQGELSYD